MIALSVSRKLCKLSRKWKWRDCHTRKSHNNFRILYFGTDKFALTTLKALHAEQEKFEYDNNGLISQLEVCYLKHKTLVSPVQEYCEHNQIKLHPWPPDLKMVENSYDFGVVASFGRLIPSKIIQSFPRGIINVHGSILPRWRGAAPVMHAILNGDVKSGISIVRIEPKHFDIGDILAIHECSIGKEEFQPSLLDKLADIGSNLLLKVLKNLDEYESNILSQSSQGITYAPKITKDMLEIQWQNKNNIEIFNQYRALSTMGKLYTFLEGSKQIIRFSDMIYPSQMMEIQNELDLKYENDCPGKLRHIKNKDGKIMVWIKCKKGWVTFNFFFNSKGTKYTSAGFYQAYLDKTTNKICHFISSK